MLTVPTRNRRASVRSGRELPVIVWVLALLLAGALGWPAGPAAAEPIRVDALEVELVADRVALVAGQPLRLGLRMAHDPQWHTYWKNPGDSGLPTRFELELPEGFSAGPIQWPAPQRQFIAPLANYGYEGEVLLLREIVVPATLGQGDVLFKARAQWLICREVCVPGQAELSLRLPVSESGGGTGAATAPGRFAALFARTDAQIPSQQVAVDYSRTSDGLLSLYLPAALIGPDAQRTEFFAEHEASIDHTAAQTLYRLDDGSWRIELPLAGALRPLDADISRAAFGVLRIAGRKPLQLTPGEPVVGQAGTRAGRVDGVENAPSLSAGGKARSAADRLLDAVGLRGNRPLTAVEPENGLASGAMPAAAPAGSLLGASTGIVNSLVPALLFAAIGGLILNLMPCVFPVIGLKVLGFAGHGGAGERLDRAARARVRAGTLWFAAGVIVSFWMLAALLLALRAAGQAAGWGFQLQSPTFIVVMGLLFVAIGLNLSGLFEFGLVLTRLGELEQRSAHSHRSAFLSGALAVLVATPCTAPFMGSALGYTLSQPAPQAMAVFTALGLGMATPYVLLGLFPGWLRLLPRPGRWMESFRQLLAFPMYAAAAWLGWVLGQQIGVDAMLAYAIAAVLMGMAAWAWGRFVQGRASVVARASAGVLVALCLAGALWIAWSGSRDDDSASLAADGTQIDWQRWSTEAVDAARHAGRLVVVDFTAAWCVSCQVNKRLVFDSDRVRAAFERNQVLALRADWTRQDPRISAELARFGRNGVPLYLVYGPALAQPQVLPEILSVERVISALDAARR